MKAIILSLLIMGVSLASHAKTLTIGIDLSGSNPLLTHQNFAYGAAEHTASVIGALKSGDNVVVKTFGARGEANNLLNHRIEISRRMKPAKAAGIVAQYILSLPSQKNASQASTNLIAWLEFTSGFNCPDSGEILVITDAVESSSFLDANDLLSGKKGLPEPDVDLKGCALTFYGVGAGFAPQSVKIVRNEWRTWAKKAGADFSAIIP